MERSYKHCATFNHFCLVKPNKSVNTHTHTHTHTQERDQYNVTRNAREYTTNFLLNKGYARSFSITLCTLFSCAFMCNPITGLQT